MVNLCKYTNLYTLSNVHLQIYIHLTVFIICYIDLTDEYELHENYAIESICMYCLWVVIYCKYNLFLSICRYFLCSVFFSNSDFTFFLLNDIPSSTVCPHRYLTLQQCTGIIVKIFYQLLKNYRI